MVQPSELPPGTMEAFEQLFGQLFGTTPGSRERTRHLPMALPVTLAEASEGAHRWVEVARFIACQPCWGRGAAEEADISPCEACDGKGEVEQQQGFFQIRTACAECKGRGEIREPPCPACDGEGGHFEPEVVEVRIPSGAADGQVLSIEGKGNDLRDGEGPGELLLTLTIGPDPRFARDGDDLHCTVRIEPALAAEGGTVFVLLPGDAVEVEVAPGTTSGTKIRMVGYGALKLGAPPVPRPTGKEVPYRSTEASAHRGDLVVTFVIEDDESREAHTATLGVPPDASASQIQRAFRQIAMANHPDRNPGSFEAARRFEQASAAYSALNPERPRVGDEVTQDERRDLRLTVLLIALVSLIAISWVLTRT